MSPLQGSFALSVDVHVHALPIENNDHARVNRLYRYISAILFWGGGGTVVRQHTGKAGAGGKGIKAGQFAGGWRNFKMIRSSIQIYTIETSSTVSLSDSLFGCILIKTKHPFLL
jgi:hypothetical protein